jgi:hypothetical protein
VNARITLFRGSVGAPCSECDYSYVLSIMHGCKREFGAIVQVSDKCIILSRLIACHDMLLASIRTRFVCIRIA